MSDILIKDMKMPKDKTIAVVIHPDGTAYSAEMFAGVCTKYLTDCEAVPVQPHGRLIEESKVLDIVFEWCPDDDGSVGKVGDLREMLDEIEALPSIIPAEEGET